MKYECKIDVSNGVLVIYKVTSKLTYIAHYYEGKYYKNGKCIAIIINNKLCDGLGRKFIMELPENLNYEDCQTHVDILNILLVYYNNL